VILDLVDDHERLLRLLLLHIAVNGPKLRGDAARRAQAAQAGLVICGHSHVPFIGRDRGLSVFNPGSIGPRRFHLPIVFGLLTLEKRRISLEHVDCESGQRWLP
jgi:predicted phosphodiesterase